MAGSSTQVDVCRSKGESAPSRPYGLATLAEKFGSSSIVTPNSSRPVNIVVQAIHISELPLTEFYVHHASWFHTLPDSPASLTDAVGPLPRTTELFQNLRFLSLRFHAAPCTNEEADRLVRLVTSMPALEELFLAMEATSRDFTRTTMEFLLCDGILRSKIPRLTELDLEGATVDFDVLAEFCRQHKRLRTL
jgi:hypothetical protein